MLASIAAALLAGLGSLPQALADAYCDENVPCAIGCCGKYNVCGMGPTYCGADNCINNCDSKAECNPGDWPSEYVNSTACPLNVCCSKYGFCGTTEDFCGDSKVTRPSCDVGSQSLTRVIGYYASAGASRVCGGMQPASFPQGVYSHVYFAFGSIEPDTLEVVPDAQSDETLYQELKALQSRDLGQKLWLSIGGWTFSDDGSPTATTFSDVAAADDAHQEVFFVSLTLFMLTWGFDGVDIDWEYPAATDRNGRAEDYKNFPAFLKNLRKALDQYNFGLSVTLPTSYWYLQHFDLTAIEPSVDWFNYMSYDLHGTWDMGNEWTGAYLSAHTNLTEIETALDLLWRNNITASKVNLGLAFYGRSFTLASGDCTEPGCEYLSAGDKGSCSDTAGILFNSEIANIISDKDLTPTFYKDAAVKAVSWDNDQWVSFDDKDTFKLKGDFAKSQCLGGVLVWSVDYDDSSHTYSKGLAAALGNRLNLNISSGLTVSSFGAMAAMSGGTIRKLDEDETTTTTGGQEKYCRFINCGDLCPSGYTTVYRDDKKPELMLDSTHCPPGSKQTQTLCCPTASEVPTCRWRGFHNNGHCKPGCNDDEVEIGTVHKGCSKGYQSACCTVTESTKPWTKCQWTTSCSKDQTCPSDFPTYITSSRQGFGGQSSCDGSHWYNLCCRDSSPPDAFTNCQWAGHEVEFTNTKYCSDACPSGSIRIAEQDIEILWGAGKTANTDDCYYGTEAYCCKGTKETTLKGRSSTVYQDQTAEDFATYLKKFLSDPVCPPDWDSQYSPVYTWDARRRRRDLDLQGRATVSDEQRTVLTFLLPIMEVWLTSEYPREDLTAIWTDAVEDAGLSEQAANISTFREPLFGEYQSDWVSTPNYAPATVIADALCSIADSADGLNELALATEVMCEDLENDPDSEDAALARRSLTESCMNDRSSDGVQPTITAALRGVLNGDLSIHYLRWVNAGGTQFLLEIGFWIGPTPGVAPDDTLRAQYADTSHTAATDRWIIMHLHIDLGRLTFRSNSPAWYPGVTTVTVYHSQGTYRPPAVTQGRTADLRAEFRRSSNYANGVWNTGDLRDYNARTQALRCFVPAQTGNRNNHNQAESHRLYVGSSRANQIRETRGVTRPGGYMELLNGFSLWLYERGVFSTTNLQMLFPRLLELGASNADDFPTPTSQDYTDYFEPPIPSVLYIKTK
ncbi:hypothetical protein BDW75DRAFT_249985 [Aspergillus navahoensis]